MISKRVVDELYESHEKDISLWYWEISMTPLRLESNRRMSLLQDTSCFDNEDFFHGSPSFFSIRCLLDIAIVK